MEKQMDSKNPSVQPKAVRRAVTDTRMNKMVAVVKTVNINDWQDKKIITDEAAREIPAPL